MTMPTKLCCSPNLLCSYKRCVLKSDCFIRVYHKLIIMVSVLLEYIDLFSQTFHIMLALSLATYCAQSYAGIISWSLVLVAIHFNF